MRTIPCYVKLKLKWRSVREILCDVKHTKDKTTVRSVRTILFDTQRNCVRFDMTHEDAYANTTWRFVCTQDTMMSAHTHHKDRNFQVKSEHSRLIIIFHTSAPTTRRYMCSYGRKQRRIVPTHPEDVMTRWIIVQGKCASCASCMLDKDQMWTGWGRSEIPCAPRTVDRTSLGYLWNFWSHENQ